MRPVEKQRQKGDAKRSGYASFETGRAVRKRRHWNRVFLISLFLAALSLGVLGAYLSANPAGENTGKGGPSEQADAPQSGSQGGPEDGRAQKEPAVAEEPIPQAAPPPPEDRTLFLTVPRLGIQGHTVRDDDSETALDLGAIKLPETGFPWEEGANTYIACHRLGFPENESFNQCLNLPSMQKGDDVYLADTNGTVYRYRVSETLQVTPQDRWVKGPVAGKDMVSLQTCIETVGDVNTLGPLWSARYVVRADRVA